MLYHLVFYDLTPEPRGMSAVQTKNSPGVTTGGQTTWKRESEIKYKKRPGYMNN